VRRRYRIGMTALLCVSLIGCATSLSRDELAIEYYNIGSAYFELEELDKSATYLSRAIELQPGLARASYNLARVYVLQERYADAVALLDELLAGDPDNTLVMETLAYAHYETGALELAATWLDRALEVNPTDPELLQNRATVALAREHTEEAIAALRRALEFTDDRPMVSLKLARAQDEVGDTRAALDAYRDYVDEAGAPQPEALLRYAELLERQEYYADALSALERITRSEDADDDRKARANFARARLLLTEAEEAEAGLEALREAVALGFADADAAQRLIEREDLVVRPEVALILREAGLFDEEPAPGDEPPDGDTDRDSGDEPGQDDDGRGESSADD
jgi:tetratricopeptide (TPR) repeat protein